MSAFSKKMYSISNFKCPQCHQGDFLTHHIYDLKHVGDIHLECNVCGLKYEKEPGFYQGAMYVSYALGVALFVTLWVSMNLFFDNINVGLQIFIIIFSTFILSPFLFALSKIIWANMFIKYDPNAGKVKKN
jgi:hypothetical protein